MKTDVCKHQNRPSECLLCMEAIPTFLRRQQKDYDCAISMLAAQTVAKSKLLGENLVLKARIADLRERHEAFVRAVRDAAHEACLFSSGEIHRNELLAIVDSCDAELGKEGK